MVRKADVSTIDRRQFLQRTWSGVGASLSLALLGGHDLAAVYYGPMIPFNPHNRYYEGDRRGYFLASVTPRRMRVDLRFVTTVEDRSGTGYTERAWIVENGVPGALPV